MDIDTKLWPARRDDSTNDRNYITDICSDMFAIINNFTTGLQSNSASKSDQWMTTIHIDDNVFNLFIKIYVLDDSIDSTQTTIDHFPIGTHGLIYETEVYKQVISILQDVCPFFVYYYGSCTKTFQEIIQMIQPHIFNEGESCSRHIIRNLYYLYVIQKSYSSYDEFDLRFIEKYCPERKCIRPTLYENTEDTSDIQIMIQRLYNIPFRYNVLDSMEKTLHKSISMFEVPSKWTLYFQIVYTLLVMVLQGLNHNDLHLGNVFIEKLSQPVILTFTITFREQVHTFSFITEYIIRIYDFDLSFSTSIGINKYSQYVNDTFNEFSTTRDMLYITTNIINSIISNCIINRKSSILIWDSIKEFLAIRQTFIDRSRNPAPDAYIEAYVNTLKIIGGTTSRGHRYTEPLLPNPRKVRRVEPTFTRININDYIQEADYYDTTERPFSNSLQIPEERYPEFKIPSLLI